MAVGERQRRTVVGRPGASVENAKSDDRVEKFCRGGGTKVKPKKPQGYEPTQEK